MTPDDLSHTVPANTPSAAPAGKPTPPESRTELMGTVRKVIWSDPESGAHVVALALANGEERIAKGRAEQDEIEVGVAYRFLGRYEHHHRHGEQFAWQTFIRCLPHDKAGIVKYLTDLAPHVGRITAFRLWDEFGGEAERVLRCDPARVIAAGIMSKEHATEASGVLAKESAFADTKIDLFTIFAGRGFPMKNLLPWLLQTWGKKSPFMVRRDPFAMMLREAPGCGWKRCDKLYRDLGHRLDTLKRQALCAWAIMREDSGGHTWHPAKDVARELEKRIVGRKASPTRAMKVGIIGELLSRCRLDPATRAVWIADAEKAKNESIVCRKIEELLSWPECIWPRDSLASAGLSEHQFRAVCNALTRPIAVLAGTPGTGKTFSAAAVIRKTIALHGSHVVAVCAPTGKAAVRITDTLKRYGVELEATTIHRLLGVGRNGHDGRGWGFIHNASKPLPYTFIVVDESSMLDIDLAASLLSACNIGTHILFVGDPYQLPPVGHGAFLRDIIAAKVPTAMLNEVQRNSGMIVSGCVAIKNGEAPDTAPLLDLDGNRNLVLVAADKPDQQIQALLRTISALRAHKNIGGDKAPLDLIWDVQVITPQNKKSAVSKREVNKVLQTELNPLGRRAEPLPLTPRAEAEIDRFCIGDKIICQANSWMFSAKHVADASKAELRDAKSVPRNGPHENADCYLSLHEVFVANGELAKVVAVPAELTPEERAEGGRTSGKCIAELSGPFRRIVVHRGKVLDEDDSQGSREIKESDFTLAYGITVHKSQGSEWRVVIVMLDEQAGFLGVRELLYTAVSRASDTCILIGKPWTLKKWCQKESLSKRRTFLATDLGHAVSKLVTREGESNAVP